MDEFEATGRAVRDRLNRFVRQHAVAEIQSTAAGADASRLLRLVDERGAGPFAAVQATDAALLAWCRMLTAGAHVCSGPGAEQLVPLTRETAAAVLPAEIAGIASHMAESHGRVARLGEMATLTDRVRAAAATGSMDACVLGLAGAAQAMSRDSQQYVRLCSCLGLALGKRYQKSRQASDTTWWIWATSEALRSPPAELRGEYLRRSGVAHSERFELVGEQADLDQALESLRAACVIADVVAEPHPFLDLGATLTIAYQAGSDTSHLDEAVQVLRRLLAHEPASTPQRTRLYNNLASALYLRFDATGNLPDLDDAVTLYRSAAELPDDPADRALYLANLGGVLAVRYQQAGAGADLEEGLSTLRESLSNTAASSDMRPERLDSYGVALQISFQQTGDIASLEESISALREAVRLAHTDSGAVPPFRNLAGGLEARFELQGQQRDLDEAIAIYRRITISVAESDHALPMYLVDTGNALGRRYSYSGDIHDLDEGIEFLRRGVGLMPADEAERCIALHTLGVHLEDRFEHRGARADLDEAQELLRASVAATPASHAFRPVHLGSLALCLQSRFELDGDQARLDEAVRLHEQAAAAGLTGVSHATALTNLGAALITRYRSQDVLSDLQRAIAAFEDSVAAAGPDYPNLCLYRANLGEALILSARDTRNAHQADIAVATLTTASNEAGQNHPQYIAIMTFLARAFAARAELTATASDQQQALQAWRTAAGIPTAPASKRLTAATEWAAYAGQTANGAEALAACRGAVHILPLVAWRGLRRRDQERLIGESHDVTADGVAWALNTADAKQAIQLAEEGRSILWSQMLETRGDLTRVYTAHPAIAAELERVRSDLQQEEPAELRRLS